jgi:hypothetical protein
MRTAGFVAMAMAVAAFPARAQFAEPILTKSALPFLPGAGALKLDYAGGGASQVIPEFTLEAGAADGLEVLARFPLLRVRLDPDSTVIGGGQVAAGARYLVAGGTGRAYAVSVQGIVEAPTGDTRLVGNAVQLMPSLLAEWNRGKGLAVYSNLTFDRSLGGTRSKAAFLEYQHAATWRTKYPLVPVIELVGSTDTLRGRTQLVALPEMLVRLGAHLEGKAGLQLGLTSAAPPRGVRIQLAAFWGRRD